MQSDDQHQESDSIGNPDHGWSAPTADHDAIPFAPPPHQMSFVQPGDAWPVQPYPVTPTPKNRKLIFGLTGGVAAVLVLGGIGAIAAFGGSSSNRAGAQQSSSATTTTQTDSTAPLAGSTQTAAAAGAASPGPVSLPAGAGGLVLLTNSLGKDEASRVQQGVEKGGSVYNNVLVGSYGKTASGGFTTVFVIQSISNLSSADQYQVNGISPSDFVDQLASGVKMTDGSDVQTTNSEASMRCGTMTADGQSLLTCIWMDARTFGLAYFYNTYVTTPKASAAQYTDALRVAAEHG